MNLLCRLFGHKCNSAQLMLALIEMKNGVKDPQVFCQREKREMSWRYFGNNKEGKP